MGWDTGPKIIKGITYYNGTPFVLNGNVACYRSCDRATPSVYKDSVQAYYYGYFSAAYSQHPYNISFSRPGQADYYVDESAFPPAVYYVYYNLEGGYGSFDSQWKYYGGSVNIHNRQPTRTGYTFKGWTTSQGSTVPEFFTDSPYYGNSNIALYAIWEINRYTVTYDANGGSCATTANTCDYGTSVTHPVPTRTGYTFAGWYTEQEPAENATPHTAAITGNITLYAKWEINKYQVTVNANGGYFNNSATTLERECEYKHVLVLPEVMRVGYTFVGWVVAGKGTLRKTGNTWNLTVSNGDARVTAQWAIKEYCITFNASYNGGTPSRILDYNYGEMIGTKAEALYTPFKPYCEFIGWYLVPYETDAAPIDLNNLMVTQNLVLYAHFKEKNNMYVSAEGETRPAMTALYARDKFIEECEVMVYADGAWRKAVTIT